MSAFALGSAQFSDLARCTSRALCARVQTSGPTANTILVSEGQGRLSATRGTRGSGCHPSGYHTDQGVVNTRVKLFADIDPQMLESSNGLERFSIGALRREGIEGIRRAQNPGTERDRIPLEAERITRAIPMLVVVFDVLEGLPDVKKRLQYLQSDAYVLLHVLELLGGETAGLVEDRFTDADLAHVVQPPRDAEILADHFFETELLGQLSGKLRDALGMAAQIDILRLHGIDESLGDADRHQAQGLFLALELGGAQGDFLTNQLVQVSLLHQRCPLLKSTIHRLLQIGELYGLHHVVGRPRRENFGGRRGIVDRRQHDDGEVFVAGTSFRNDLDPGHSGHADVAEHQRKRLLIENLQSLIAGAGDLDLVAAGAQKFSEREPNGLFVVDDEDSGHWLFSTKSGRRIVKVDPTSGVLSTAIVPPCAWMIP